MDRTQEAIGIDVGGTGIAIGLINGAGEVLAREDFATRCPGGFNESIERIIAVCRRLRAGHPATRGVRGVGVGCPGPLNLATGEVLNPFTMDWQGRNLVKPIREALGLSVVLENDADAALVGEAAFGAGRGASRMAMLTFGTGAGGSVLLDGKVLRGAADEHPEIGHAPALFNGPQCYCGVAGCLEIVASGQAIDRHVEQLGLTSPSELFDAAAQADARCHAEAAEVVRQIQAACASIAATLIRAYSPELIILGGGIIEHQYELYAAPMRALIAASTMLPPTGVRVAKAELGNDAGMIGAAMLILGRE